MLTLKKNEWATIDGLTFLSPSVSMDICVASKMVLLLILTVTLNEHLKAFVLINLFVKQDYVHVTLILA